jgi:acetylornithine deacetylase/succinyl-diaminopimelate desuccinylase-like protein
MEERTIAREAAHSVGAEAVALLQRLIRFDTVNPPGNEAEAQDHLMGLLEGAGWECEQLERVPGRPNLVARLRGAAAGPSLGMISHVDTVPADPAEWTRDPWGGDLAEGYVWGRGALDMKDQVASETAACVALGRDGWRPARGDLLLVVSADEETGAHNGAKWLCEEHPEKVRCQMVVNEGGGVAIDFDGRRLFTLAVGEKGVFRFRVKTRGVAGHASIPGVGDNALLKLGPLLERLRSQPAPETTPDTGRFLSVLLGEPAEDRAAARERIRAEDPQLATLLAEPMLGVTLTPTMASGSGKQNVVPSAAELLVDCRVPPEMEAEDVRRRIAGVLGAGDHEVEFTEQVVGNRSDFTGPLAEAIEEWVGAAEPGAEVVPLVMPGFSDSHWFRRAFGATVFGFCPQSAMSLAEERQLVHAADERIAVADVELMASFFHWLPQRLLGASDG